MSSYEYLAARDDSDTDPCGPNPTDNLNLRIGAVFVILVTSLIGTFFPVLAKRTPALRNVIPGIVFEFAKFFGSGVITATALIHLLEPAADDELGPANTIALGGCISNDWADYPYAFGICLVSLYMTFVAELFAYRIGTNYLAKRGVALQPEQVHGLGAALPPSQSRNFSTGEAYPEVEAGNAAVTAGDASDKDVKGSSTESLEQWSDASEQMPAAAQILGVAILEFGVLFHSVIIGLTLSLASPDEFTTLFIVIIFHQMFEGLGLGSRLAFLKLPASYSYVPFLGAFLYTLMTPIGMAIGLGTRETTSMSSASASIASGVLDSISAGILLYAATVELIAHEFIFNHFYHTCSWKRVIFSLGCFALGAGIMALLGMSDRLTRKITADSR